MPRLLLEDASEFVVDRSALTEHVQSSVKFPVTVKGRLSVCEELNGNNRWYPKSVWERQTKPGSKLHTLIEKNRSLGLLEHPKDAPVSLLSPIATSLKKVWLQESTKGGKPVTEVWGEIAILGTAEGRKLWALVEGGYNPLVSSRGYGSLERRPDGTDLVCEDFECEGWDAVYIPSFSSAELDGQSAREALVNPKAATLPWESLTPTQRFDAVNKAVNEGKIKADSVRLVDGIVVVESAKPTAPAAQEAKPAAAPTIVSPPSNNITTMDKLTPIRESIKALQSVNVTNLEPAQLAEHLNRATELHRSVAGVASEDTKASWDCQRLHEELNKVETSLSEAAKAPARRAEQLAERELKTLKTVKAIAEVGGKFRTKLAESLKTVEAKTTELTEAIRRGRGWMARAKLAEQKLEKLSKQYDIATEGLDILAERYHSDTSELARQLMIVEMKITDKAVLDRLTEAKTVKQLTAIREELTKAAPAKVEEAAKPAAAPAANAPASPVPTSVPQNVVQATNIRPFSVLESVSMTRRLAGVNG